MLLTFAALLETHSFLCGQWQLMSSAETKASLRGVYNAGNGVIWASGSAGTILRTTNNGLAWQQCPIPLNAEKLDFRGIWGFDANRAITMSSGLGDASRLYETTDGCRSWHLVFTNPDRTGFWDAIAFHNETGVLLGDPVDNHFVVYTTTDSGKHWIREQSAALAAHPKGEGVFAASNSALAIRPDGKILFGTGGLGGPRIFASELASTVQWTAVSVPLKGNSEAAGVFSLAFRDSERGVAVGGDYKNPENRDGTAAFTSDGGKSWRVAVVFPGGFRSAVGWDRDKQAWIAVGPNGSDISTDNGQTWRTMNDAGWNALSVPWVVGSNGRIARLEKGAILPLPH